MNHSMCAYNRTVNLEPQRACQVRQKNLDTMSGFQGEV